MKRSAITLLQRLLVAVSPVILIFGCWAGSALGELLQRLE